MAAPSIAWYRLTKATAGTYSAITSLNFGTVTAGAWSVMRVVRPKVTVNSIQSAEWWFSDIAGVRSAASVGMGTANSWKHFMTIYGTYTAARAIVGATAGYTAASPKGSAGVSGSFKEVPQSTGSGVAYSATSLNAYGDVCVFTIKVPSAAGNGAHTAWGYQLKYSYT